MGVSSLPIETISTEFRCSEEKEGEKCVVVDGGVSIFFEEEADVNPSDQEFQLLLHIKEEMGKGNIGTNNDDRIKGLVFVKGKNLMVDRGDTLVGKFVDVNDNEVKSANSGIGVASGLIIGCAILMFIATLAAVIRGRSRTSGFATSNPRALQILDTEYDGNGDDEDNTMLFSEFSEFTPTRSRQQDMSFPVVFNENTKLGKKKYLNMEVSEAEDEMGYEVYGSDRRKKRHRVVGEEEERYAHTSFPVKLTETHNGKRFPVSREIVNHDPRTHDVHYCTSSLCQCKQDAKNKIQFISSDSIEDVELELASSWDRISDRTYDYSKPSMNVRSYDNERTITL